MNYPVFQQVLNVVVVKGQTFRCFCKLCVWFYECILSKTHRMSNFEIQKKLINVAACQIKTELTAKRIVIMENLIVPYLVKKFIVCCTT